MLTPDKEGVNIKVWIDAQTGSTVNLCAMVQYGQKLAIVIDKT